MGFFYAITMKTKTKYIHLLLTFVAVFSCLIITNSASADNYRDVYRNEQRYAKDLAKQAKDDYDRQMIYCRKNSVFYNSCADNAKKEYTKRRRDAEQIYANSRTNERQLQRDEYNRRQAQRQQQYRDKQYRDQQRGYQYQQDYQRKQLEKQRKFAEKEQQRQEKYLRKQQQQRNLYERQQAKRNERDRRMQDYYR